MFEKRQLHQFQETVWDYYATNSRDNLPWRKNVDDKNFGYHVLVSEMMLQQTQVGRVVEKFNLWMERFPDIKSVAAENLEDVLSQWVGLGYNRRAKYLLESCKIICETYNGELPPQIDELAKLPGIGSATASAIAVYAYNEPLVFIETNIRTVYIHHFFMDDEFVSDNMLLPLIEATVDKHNPREWYWALMDYGTFLKRKVGNVSRKSTNYKKQSKFEGSRRQLRARVVRELVGTAKDYKDLVNMCSNDQRLDEILNELLAEKIIIKTGVSYSIFNK
jgi:A/G-specific adenine glycosylase